MHANKLITINWGHTEGREFQLGHVNMFTGGSGSGKTTTADAFQTVMTAARQGVFAYNPGQNESTQRGKWGKQPRTLESYVLGAEEGGLYMRPEGAHGYIALTFIPSPGEPHGQIFTAVVAVAAQVEKSGNKRTPRRDRLHLMIIEGHELQMDDLLMSDAGEARQVVPVQQIVKHLTHKYGADVLKDHRDNKTAYLQHLYGVLRGRRTSGQDEALQAAKAFSRFMAYHPVEDIDQFVKNEVLEKRDLSAEVEHISVMMRDVGQLRNEAHRLGNNIQLLQTIREHGNAMQEAWIEVQEQSLLASLVKRSNTQQHIDSSNDNIAAIDRDIKLSQHQTADLQQEHQALEQRLRTIDRERQQHDVARIKDEYEGKIDQEMGQAVDSVTQLTRSLQGLKEHNGYLNSLLQENELLKQDGDTTALIGKLKDSAKPLLKLDIDGVEQQLSALISGRELDIDQCQQLQQPLAELDQTQQQVQGILRQGDNNLANRIERLIAQQANQQQQLSQRRREISEQLSLLKSGNGIDYPHGVALALHTLQQELPQSNAKVLCDLVEVKDEQWHAPIEAYIGGNRFNIIVKPEFEAQAITLINKTPGCKAKVIQTSLVRKDAEGVVPASDSILQQLAIENEDARLYLTASYGKVKMVESTEALRSVHRGITVDGMASANYTLFPSKLKEHELTFGKAAREKRLRAREEELAKLEIEISELDNQIKQLQKQSRIASAYQAYEVENSVNQLLRHAKQIQQLRTSIDELDISNIEELDQQRDELLKQIKQLDQQRNELLRNEGKQEQERIQQNTLLQRYQDELGQLNEDVDEKRRLLNAVLNLRKDYDIDITYQELCNEAANQELEADHIQQGIEQLKRQQQKEKEQFNLLLRDYNQEARQHERIELSADEEEQSYANSIEQIRPLMSQVRTQIRHQKESGLADVENRLEDAKQAVNNAFTASFCQRLYTSIEDGERTLRMLNEELESCRFGDDRFSFGWEWVPHYKRYHLFFKNVMSMEGLGEGQDLFDIELDKDQSKVRDEIIELLLSDDRQHAEARLSEIADYRNYRRYEIFKHTDHGEPIALSQYGTGSGGQLETPAYVIRAAAISSAFKFREGDHHLRSVIIDESFAKMDEIRARGVLEYLSKTLNLQVLFIMPSKSAGAFKDMVNHEYVFSKVPAAQGNGELRTITYVNHLILKQDEIRKAWEEYREEVRRQAAIEFEASAEVS